MKITRTQQELNTLFLNGIEYGECVRASSNVNGSLYMVIKNANTQTGHVSVVDLESGVVYTMRGETKVMKRNAEIIEFVHPPLMA